MKFFLHKTRVLKTQDLCGIFIFAKRVFRTRVLIWISSFNMDLEFLKLEIHIKTRVWKTRVVNVKMSHRSWVFKTRVLWKKNFTYSGIFKPYSDVLKPYSGVFLQKKIYKYQVWEPYSGILKPYSGVLKPYSDVFLQFMEIESLKLNFHVNFFSTSHPSSYKSRLKNSSFKHSRC